MMGFKIREHFSKRLDKLKSKNLLELTNKKALADNYFRLGNYEDAKNIYLQILETANPDSLLNCNIYYSLARIYHFIGNQRDEIKSIVKAVKIDYDNLMNLIGKH